VRAISNIIRCATLFVAFNEFDHVFRWVEEYLKGYVVNIRHEEGPPTDIWVRTTGHTADGDPTLIGWEWDREDNTMTDRQVEIELDSIIRIEVL
jgi:hypothetical protein